MPSIVRKYLVLAAVDGFIIQPLSQRNQRSAQNVQISYGTYEITSKAACLGEQSDGAEALEVHGVVGLLVIASKSYLVSITRRQQIAEIRGAPIYVVTDVSLLPLATRAEASRAIKQSADNLKKQPTAHNDSGDETSEDEQDHHEVEQVDTGLCNGHPQETVSSSLASDSPPASQLTKPRTSVVEDVIGRRGAYGRFAEKWFSKQGWSVERRRMQGMSAPHGEKKTHDQSEGAINNPSSENIRDVHLSHQTNEPSHRLTNQDQVATLTLMPKLLQSTRTLLTSRSFFFSYDHDITRRFGSPITNSPDLPLCKSVDPLFFWNQHLASPFLKEGLASFVLPLMQGFVGQQAFTVDTVTPIRSRSIVKAQDGANNPKVTEQDLLDKKLPSEKKFLITLISRRSVKRPGLRYLRRGVDDEGNTANSVETEQIICAGPSTAEGKAHSFVQFRGSIPLYFSQSPYSFKPVPVVQRSYDTNQEAFKRHFQSLVSRYGEVQIALLVDKHGGEAEIGQQYEKHTEDVNAQGGIGGVQLGFEWFDFHAICRGMKFENVSFLMDTLEQKLDAFGATVVSDGVLRRKQTGVLRTNCMDCLDRTNVVQSACGQRALEKQLKEEGVEVNLQTDQSTQWFNTLWADNGDAISRQYSSTAALKGDYTRTRKRNYRGALNDFGLTLTRYYNNIVNDYFSQAAIDYLLGNVTSQAFEEFEANMMTRDPAISMGKVRQNAIDTSAKIVISKQSEDLLGGWTLSSPQNFDTVRTFPFDEVVLLLTDAAVYAVRFDWDVEKVSSFKRVDLGSMTGIVRGTYITSIVAAAQTDETRNVGFVIKYRPGKGNIARVNTRALSSAVDEGNESDKPVAPTDCDLKGKAGHHSSDSKSPQKILAFKALPARSSQANAEDQEGTVLSEIELVRNICEEIRRAAFAGDAMGSQSPDKDDFVEERDIISLDQAKKSTGLLEQWSHSLKKLVWA